MSPNRVLIVEPNSDGHRLYYVELLARRALSARFEVTIAMSNEGETLPQEAQLWDSLDRDRVEVLAAHSTSLKEVRRLANESNADLVVVPDGDRYVLARAKRMRSRHPLRVNALIMREKVHPSRYRAVTWLKQNIRDRAIRRTDSMPNMHVFVLRSPGSEPRSGLRTAIDPISNTATDESIAVARSDLTGAEYWFAVIGAISRRKNVELVLQGALRNLDQARAGVLIAGRIDGEYFDDVMRAVAKARRQGLPVIVDNRRHSDIELDSRIAAVDCVVLAHSNEGPSGILGKAGAMGTAVLAAGASSLRDDARRLGVGRWVPLNAEAIAGAMALSLESPRPERVLAEETNSFTDPLLEWW
ncbi:glycosyltransferase family 4 protein [Curtobacterium sp. PhB115]|uniref:glycosyltransferase family 4 protein n=1 Tax=Curtobacterium sp. PhB115 TaxID=2485173 RepID=UPI000FBA74B5|nr:glycosyltransferase family 4 protein [Curtobacterium sp. PhB115]ROP74752.1 glycosyltransferase involved in cell wall biosynthesis [Curtobacterium sp. PhB115]